MKTNISMPLPWLLKAAKEGDSESQYYLWVHCLLTSEIVKSSIDLITYEEYQEKRAKAGVWAKYWLNEFNKNPKKQKVDTCHIKELFSVYEEDFAFDAEDAKKANMIREKYNKVLSTKKYSKVTLKSINDRIMALT